MKTDRRQFLASALASSVAAAAFPRVSHGSQTGKPGLAGALNSRYATLDKILAQPVLKRELFPSRQEESAYLVRL